KRVVETEAREAARAGRARAHEAMDTEKDPDRSVVPWLRALGMSLVDARQAAGACEHMTDATMEDRIKAATVAHVRARHPGVRTQLDRLSNQRDPGHPSLTAALQTHEVDARTQFTAIADEDRVRAGAE